MLNVRIQCKCHEVWHFYNYENYTEVAKDIKDNSKTIKAIIITDATDDEMIRQEMFEQVVNDGFLKPNLDRFFKCSK